MERSSVAYLGIVPGLPFDFMFSKPIINSLMKKHATAMSVDGNAKMVRP
jgi:hypothetical protein